MNTLAILSDLHKINFRRDREKIPLILLAGRGETPLTVDEATLISTWIVNLFGLRNSNFEISANIWEFLDLKNNKIHRSRLKNIFTDDIRGDDFWSRLVGLANSVSPNQFNPYFALNDAFDIHNDQIYGSNRTAVKIYTISLLVEAANS